MSAAQAPADLGIAGQALWDSIAGAYTLRPDEVATLEDACRVTDMIAFLADEWIERGKPTMTKGSMGQDIIHPLVDKMADHRMKRATLLGRLKLPDDANAAAPNQQRSAAQSRWAAAHGSGA
jgi:hypothetical protein